MYRLLTKVSEPLKDKPEAPTVFRDYHTGEVLHYQLRDSSLPRRVPVGGDFLASMWLPGWSIPGIE